MENRRYNNTNTERSFTTDRYQKKPDDRPYNERSGERKFQPRDDRYRPRDDNYQPRDNRFPPRERMNQPVQGRDERSQAPRDNRFPPREGGFERRDDRVQNRDNRFQNRDDRFQNRDNRFQNRDNRFQSRDNRFQNRDNRFQNRDNQYDPKKRFAPKKTESWKLLPKPKIVSDMQITDGKHAGKYLTSTASPKIRPTMRKMRETMLKIVGRRLRGGRFLDICAGSGMIGFEAISRGALLSTFVERSAKMCSFIRKNMAALEVKEGHAEIFEIEAVTFLKQMAKRRRFWDVVFVDPPYDSSYDEMMKYLSRGTCIKPKGMLVIEHQAQMFFPEKIGVLKRWRVLMEGDSAMSFYERQ